MLDPLSSLIDQIKSWSDSWEKIGQRIPLAHPRDANKKAVLFHFQGSLYPLSSWEGWPLDYLQFPIFPILYWKEPAAKKKFPREILTFGQNDFFSSIQCYHQDFLQQHLLMAAEIWRKLPNCKMFIGLPFDYFLQSQQLQTHSKEWDSFQKLQSILPLFVMEKIGDEFHFVANILCDENKAHQIIPHTLSQLLDGLEQIRPCNKTLPSISSVTYQPQQDTWNIMVESCLQEIAQNAALEKVVLARKMVLHHEEQIPPAQLVQKLLSRKEDSYLFFISPEKNRAFMGRTPERLFYKKGAHIYSEALAGTRPRGNTQEEDDDLGNDLLNSTKDLREHHIVREEILKLLEHLCQKVEVIHHAKILKLGQLQHLHSAFSGSLKSPTDLLHLLRTLHPTPATGGSPKELAMKVLQSLEPFSRGHYASPWGWCDGLEAEFVVAIRSALLVEKDLHLFAGCGIVPGSLPEGEWQETESKLQNFLQLL